MSDNDDRYPQESAPTVVAAIRAKHRQKREQQREEWAERQVGIKEHQSPYWNEGKK